MRFINKIKTVKQCLKSGNFKEVKENYKAKENETIHKVRILHITFENYLIFTTCYKITVKAIINRKTVMQQFCLKFEKDKFIRTPFLHDNSFESRLLETIINFEYLTEKCHNAFIFSVEP